MIGVSLLAVFVVAKLATMWGRAVDASPSTPIALLWQDVLVVLVFVVLARLMRPLGTRVTWVLYGLLVLFAAITVPIEHALSSPLTLTMLRAASGTLSDSIGHYVTVANIGWMLLVIGTGIAAPLVLRRLPAAMSARRWAAVLVVATAIVAVGPPAAARIDTRGLDRNPALTLARSALPRVRAEASDAPWRDSPFGSAAVVDDLSALHGAARGKNVLFIVLESTAARYLRAYGAADDPTPNLTALAAKSIVFDHAYTAYPESVKGIVAYLASRFPAFDVTAERHVSAVSPSLATTLANRGYATGLFHSGRFMYLGMDTLLARSGFATLRDAGDIGGNQNSSFGVDEPATVGALLKWIDSRPQDTPFFTAYLPIAGHHPYMRMTPGPVGGDSDIDRYRSVLHEGDQAIGTLIEGLKLRGLDASTLIVVFGDHGEAFRQHAGNVAHTLSIYDENVRVPLMFTLPGGSRSMRVSRTASLVDVAPTVLDLLGLESPSAFQGTSLLAARHRMALFFTDYSLGLLGLRDDCMKYIYEMESGRSRMFDLCHDPDERFDIAARYADRVARYRTLLQGWSAAQVGRVTFGGS